MIHFKFRLLRIYGALMMRFTNYCRLWLMNDNPSITHLWIVIVFISFAFHFLGIFIGHLLQILSSDELLGNGWKTWLLIRLWILLLLFVARHLTVIVRLLISDFSVLHNCLFLSMRVLLRLLLQLLELSLNLLMLDLVSRFGLAKHGWRLDCRQVTLSLWTAVLNRR